MIKNVTGFKFRASDETEYKDSYDFDIYVKLANVPLLPQKNDSLERPIGSDISYDFEDGYSKKVISLFCQLAPQNKQFFNRRYDTRDIVGWLHKSGYLILNCEPDRVYEAKLISQVDYETTNSMDIFTLNFEVQALSKSTITSDVTWDTANVLWSNAFIPWQGYGGSDINISNGTFDINNLSNYKTLPTIKITGTSSSVTMTDSLGNSFTYTNLSNETVYIDCEYKFVYSLNGSNKVNKIMNFTGDFLELDIGQNTITVSSTSTININVDVGLTYL